MLLQSEGVMRMFVDNSLPISKSSCKEKIICLRYMGQEITVKISAKKDSN